MHDHACFTLKRPKTCPNAFVLLPSDDAQRDQNDQQQRDETPDRNEEGRSLLRRHVRHIVAGKEEGHIGREEHRQYAPPFVDPDEGVVAGSGEEGLEQRKEQRHLKRAYQLAADALPSVFGKIALVAVLRQHLEGDDARQREHHRQLPAHADEQDEGGGGVGHRPQRIAEHVADDRVSDLVEPVYAVQGQPRVDRLIILLVDLRPIHIEHDREDKNERPVEVFRTAYQNGVDQTFCLL